MELDVNADNCRDGSKYIFVKGKRDETRTNAEIVYKNMDCKNTMVNNTRLGNFDTEIDRLIYGWVCRLILNPTFRDFRQT